MDNLTESIEKDFGNLLRPRKISKGDSIEAKMIERFFTESTWQEIKTQQIKDYDSRADVSALPAFLSDDGFEFLLPVFMKYIVENGASSGLLLDAVVFKLQLNPFSFKSVNLWLDYLSFEFADDEDLLEELAKIKVS